MTSLERIAQLCKDAEEEGQEIDQGSLQRCLDFFRASTIEPFPPKITLTPEGKVRAHWTDFGTMREF
ncbi:MAG TPA: hypothetical protein VI542_34950 [Candidatus Tectomicrobia bacterium]